MGRAVKIDIYDLYKSFDMRIAEKEKEIEQLQVQLNKKDEEIQGYKAKLRTISTSKPPPINGRVNSGDLDLPPSLNNMHSHLHSYSHISYGNVVYFLCSNNTVVYVGKSSNLYPRIREHVSSQDKIFDKVFFLQPQGEDSVEGLEKIFIKLHKPRYNKEKHLTNIEPTTKELASIKKYYDKKE